MKFSDIENLAIDPNYGPLAEYLSDTIGTALHEINKACQFSGAEALNVSVLEDKFSSEFEFLKGEHASQFDFTKRLEIAVLAAIDLQVGLSQPNALCFYKNKMAMDISKTLSSDKEFESMLFGTACVLFTLTVLSNLLEKLSTMKDTEVFSDIMTELGVNKEHMVSSSDPKKNALIFENIMYHTMLNWVRECFIRGSLFPEILDNPPSFNEICLATLLFKNTKSSAELFHTARRAIWLPEHATFEEACDQEDHEWKALFVNGLFVLVK